jgi:peptidoglycan/xylan/chitin deacetylase (PgdA/CDA1 family)
MVNCSCATFRLDDIQDWWARNAQLAILDVFKQTNTPITIGVITGHFGTDLELVNHIKTILQDPTWDVEVALHGFNHEDFTNYTYDEQLALLQQGVQVLTSTLGVTPKTFLPPFNAFNNDTLNALLATGFTSISSEIDLDQGPFNFVNPAIWRLPIGAATSTYRADNNFFEPVSRETTLDDVTSQFAVFGYAAVMVHPYEFITFDNGTYIDEVNETQIENLRQLLVDIKATGLTISAMGKVADLFPKFTTGSTGSTGVATTGVMTTGKVIIPSSTVIPQVQPTTRAPTTQASKAPSVSTWATRSSTQTPPSSSSQEQSTTAKEVIQMEVPEENSATGLTMTALSLVLSSLLFIL